MTATVAGLATEPVLLCGKDRARLEEVAELFCDAVAFCGGSSGTFKHG